MRFTDAHEMRSVNSKVPIEKTIEALEHILKSVRSGAKHWILDISYAEKNKDDNRGAVVNIAAVSENFTSMSLAKHHANMQLENYKHMLENMESVGIKPEDFK